jgi:squalene-hopene/tetraprenyl-beta-curcumene cyclase
MVAWAAAMAACLSAWSAGAGGAGEVQVDPAVRQAAEEAARKAVAYYRGAQLEDGAFATGDFGPAITGLAVAGMLRSGAADVGDPMIQKALAYLERHVQPDGGVYLPGENRNYPTAVAVMAFVEANKDGRYQTVIDNAAAYLKGEQWDEGEGIDPSNPKYGGAGYGRKSRPDLSNTAFFLEALQAAGVPKDDPAYQRAVRFVSRCQNLSGEGANDLEIAEKVDDGGFFYTPAELTYNPAGETPEGGLRSYGSMTYAGLKSFLYAGVSKDDPRVRAATEWIRRHYSVEENPGLGQMGLFYYYQTFAKALDALDVATFESADGEKHDWRGDLVRVLVEKQRPDGSWSNPEKRWLEDDARLVTAYCLLALAHVAR